MPLTILLVADDPKLAGPLASALAAPGYTVVRATSAEDAMHELRAGCFSLIAVDALLRGPEAPPRGLEASSRGIEAPPRASDVPTRRLAAMPRGLEPQPRGLPGLGLLQLVRPFCPQTACVLLLPSARPPASVRALRDSGIECIPRPVQRQQLLSLCQHLAADQPLYLPSRLLMSPRPPVRFGELQACSERMLVTMEQARRAAAFDCGVLLIGEKGSGKRLLGQALHACSRRAGAGFVTLSPKQAACLLLGEGTDEEHGERAALLARARGGTVYVRNIEALPPVAQARLLACLEGEPLLGADGAPVDLRLLIGTTGEPEDLITCGLLRPDLYDHLAGCLLRVPPLRERERDVLLLATERLRELDAAAGRSGTGNADGEPVLRLSLAAQRLLAIYAWPGNVRELRAAVLHAAQQAGRGEILPVHLPGRLREQLVQARYFYIPISSTLAAAERAVVLGQLALNDGNKGATAEVLGISRRSLYSKLAEYQRLASDSAAEERPEWTSYGEAPPVHPGLLALHSGDPDFDRYLALRDAPLDELLGDEASEPTAPRPAAPAARSVSAA